MKPPRRKAIGNRRGGLNLSYIIKLITRVLCQVRVAVHLGFRNGE